MQIRTLLLATAVLAPAWGWAGPQFEVAGVKVTVVGEGWEVSDAKGRPVLTGGGGIDGVKPGEGKLLVKREAGGRLLAAILVSANRGRGNVTLRGTCPDREPQPTVYEYKYGNPKGGPRTCATVAGPFSVDGTLKHFEYLAEAQAASGFPVPEAAYFFWGYAFDQTGALFNVEGLAATDFAGLENVKPANPPGADVKPEIAAWGDALGASIRQAHDGVFSRSTTLPPFLFKSGTAPR